MADERREHASRGGVDSEQELARELRAWRVDRVLVPVVLAVLLVGVALVEVVGREAVAGVWRWSVLVLLVFTGLRGIVLGIREWRRQGLFDLDSSLPPVSHERASQVAADLAADSVREEDRDLAARQLLVGRLAPRGQVWIWVSLGTFWLYANPDIFALALRIALLGVVASMVVVGYRTLETRTAEATRFLDRPATTLSPTTDSRSRRGGDQP